MNLTRVFLDSIKTLRERLFEHITPYEIYCNLVGFEIEIGQTILSPIRRDNRPTFVLFVPEDRDEVFFKDFAWLGGDVFKFIKLYAIYKENEVLIKIGAYQKGVDRELDEAVSKIEKMKSFLLQNPEERFEFEQIIQILRETLR